MSGVSKPSGIKPPSKVTKPSLAAVNGNEAENGTASRRASEDMGKKKLPVLARKISVTEHGVDDDVVGDLPKQHDRKISEASRKLSDGSIDTAWEQARRLSEAGVRRMSDASVLTVDTDSFIVGDRVFVNGVKPGYIQYIGEAKFAPGEWAGIVLDDTSGKNNGSVGGVRYFQCQPLRGIFSRLTRLTRFPLEGAEMPSDTASEAPTSSPTPSKVDAPSKASSPAPSLPPPSDLKIGQRVIVNSSLGSKAGVLRYMGGTDFAAGNWAGVELDDPIGKNDGTVGEKRYFECRANHGLFAPIHKVSLSPANAMRRVSSSATPTRPGLTRQGTRDSMGSISVSSMASTASRVRLGVQSLTTPNKRPSRPSPPAGTASALQEMLREKEKQIEQLLKEREFERAALVRAAAQTEEAEKRVIESNKKLNQLEDEANGEVQRLQLLLTKGEEERKRTTAQWEEDRRRLEDLQFQLEEATIIKSDAEGRNGELENRIRELEKSLTDELTKNEELEKEANRGFELEEQLVTLKEEKDALLLEIKKFKDGLVSADSELQQELVNTKEKLIALEEALAEKEKCIQLEKEEKEKWHAVVNQVEEKNDELNEQILELTDLVKTKEQTLQAKHQELEMAQLDIKHVKETADKEECQLDELSANIVKQEAEIQQLNHTIQALNLDKLDWLRKYEDLESRMKQITHDKDETQRKLEMKNQELEMLKQNLSDLQKALEGNSEEQTKMLEKLKNSQEMERELVLVNQEVDNLKRLLNAEKESAASMLQEKTGEVSKLQEKLSESEMELVKKTAELEQQLKDALEESIRLRTRLAEIETIRSTEAKDSQSMVDDLNEVLQEREEQARKTLEASQAKLQKLERVCEESELNLKELRVKFETMEAEAKKVLSGKEESDTEVTKLAEELRQIQAQLHESQVQYDKLKADLTEKSTQASHEGAEQRNQVARLEEDLANVRLSNADLQQTLQTVQNQREALEKERVLSNDAVKERDAKLAQVTLEVERLKSTFDTHRAELQKKLEQTLKEAEMAEELRTALEKTRTRGQEMEALAHERETELFELQEQKRAFVEELERLSQYESERETYRQQLVQKDQEISLLSKDYAKLQTELSSFNARYEKDKRVWEQKVVDFQIKKQISLQETQPHDPQVSQLLEEKEASKREIAFLNSVIVDMQRKLDEGKLQLEISHASLMNQGISEVVQKNGVAKRLVAPRLFCDICDTFDLHDTEDCPKQSSFDEGNDLPTPPHSQHQGKRNEPRPYCNTCEAFGHLTSDCTEEDTY